MSARFPVSLVIGNDVNGAREMKNQNDEQPLKPGRSYPNAMDDAAQKRANDHRKRVCRILPAEIKVSAMSGSVTMFDRGTIRSNGWSN